jgi:hypothetical protein
MSLLTELSLFRDNFYKHGAPMALPLKLTRYQASNLKPPNWPRTLLICLAIEVSLEFGRWNWELLSHERAELIAMH